MIFLLQVDFTVQLRMSNTALRLLLFTCAPKYTQMTVHNMRLNYSPVRP